MTQAVSMSPGLALNLHKRMLGSIIFASSPNYPENTGTQNPAYTLLFGLGTATFNMNQTGVQDALTANPATLQVGMIQFMKGTPPTDFSGLTSATSRASDVLCTWMDGIYIDPTLGVNVASPDFNPSNFTNNPVTISTNYKNATQSGTATWLWWKVISINSSVSAIAHQAFGTLGGLGSGMDLELQSTSIVAGQPYRFINLQLTFPTSWTY